MEIKTTKVFGLEESISDSGLPMTIDDPPGFEDEEVTDKDKKRAKRLANNSPGTGHNNFLKGIIVQFYLKYPQYLAPQLQRYNFIDIVSSQSKMHKLTSVKNIDKNCNSYVMKVLTDQIDELIDMYNNYNEQRYFVDTDTNTYPIGKKEDVFKYIISNLPMGYELWMKVSTNYLQLKTIYKQRRKHKLDEWQYFCNWIEQLPESNLITGKEK